MVNAGFFSFFLFWCKAISLKNFFEVTVKCIREREISTLYWTDQKQEGPTCWGPGGLS